MIYKIIIMIEYGSSFTHLSQEIDPSFKHYSEFTSVTIQFTKHVQIYI